MQELELILSCSAFLYLYIDTYVFLEVARRGLSPRTPPKSATVPLLYSVATVQLVRYQLWVMIHESRGLLVAKCGSIVG